MVSNKSEAFQQTDFEDGNDLAIEYSRPNMELSDILLLNMLRNTKFDFIIRMIIKSNSDDYGKVMSLEVITPQKAK